MTIYSEKFETLAIFCGDLPAGKDLDVAATDKNLKKSFDAAMQAEFEKYSASDLEDEATVAHIKSVVGERLLESVEWYEDAYVWVSKNA